MYIRALGLLLFLTRVLLAQEPTPILPDANMTPGDTFDITAQDICAHGYARKVRDVPAQMKREVYREYGIISHGPGDYEIDHLIPLELGGSNSIKNLWPESHRTSPWNAQVKDRLEDKLHEMVCSGQLDLKTAQKAIASNWNMDRARTCALGCNIAVACNVSLLADCTLGHLFGQKLYQRKCCKFVVETKVGLGDWKFSSSPQTDRERSGALDRPSHPPHSSTLGPCG